MIKCIEVSLIEHCNRYSVEREVLLLFGTASRQDETLQEYIQRTDQEMRKHPIIWRIRAFLDNLIQRINGTY